MFLFRLFRRKKHKEELEEDEDVLLEKSKKIKIKDLAPQNRRHRKEPQKPWGRRERLWILFVVLLTVILSILFGVSGKRFDLSFFGNGS